MPRNPDSDSPTALVPHPDLEETANVDDHGPVFPATLEGLEEADPYQIAEDGDQDGEEDHHG